MILLLKLDFNCCNSFVLYWVDKVTIGIAITVCLDANLPAPLDLQTEEIEDNF